MNAAEPQSNEIFVICESFIHSLNSYVINITALVNNASRCLE